jgi:excisionase family DNA binding protein
MTRLDHRAGGCYFEGVISVDGEEYLTVQEAARRLGVKVETLYAYVSRGRLRSYRQGIKRRRLYRRVEVDRLLELAPSEAETLARPRSAAVRPAPEIPLAESWIRD